MMPEGNAKTHHMMTIHISDVGIVMLQTFNDFNRKFNELSSYVINELKQVQKLIIVMMYVNAKV